VQKRGLFDNPVLIIKLLENIKSSASLFVSSAHGVAGLDVAMGSGDKSIKILSNISV
jgi:hypothetical protein